MTGDFTRTCSASEWPTRGHSATAGSTNGTTASTSVGNSTSGGGSGGRWKGTRHPGRLRGELRRCLGHALGRRGDELQQYRTDRAAESSTPRRTSTLQRKTLEIAEGELDAGVVREVDVDQARSTLEQTEAGIPELQIAQRQFANALCTLLGIPPEDLEARLGSRPIPTAPPEVAIGIPADLLLRRPDFVARNVRRPRKRADRHRPGRVLSPRFHRRRHRRFGPALLRSFPGRGAGGQRRPDVHLEHPQLWADPQQRPSPGRQVPGAGGHLSEHRAQRESRGGERAGASSCRRSSGPGSRRPA